MLFHARHEPSLTLAISDLVTKQGIMYDLKKTSPEASGLAFHYASLLP